MDRDVGLFIRGVIAVGILLFGGLFLLAWISEKQEYDELKRTCIATVEADVLSIKVNERNDVMTSAEVEFTAGSEKYTLNTGYTFDKKELGGTVPVHYCPADPKKAYCYDSPQEPTSEFLGVAAFMLAVAVLVILIGVIDREKPMPGNNYVPKGAPRWELSPRDFDPDRVRAHLTENDLKNARTALGMNPYIDSDSDDS